MQTDFNYDDQLVRYKNLCALQTAQKAAEMQFAVEA
jgi:hypothetical protein